MEIVLVVVVAAVVAGVVVFVTRPRGARYPAVGGAAAVPQAPVAVKAAAQASPARGGTGEIEEEGGQPAVAGGRADVDDELRMRRAEIARIEERLPAKEESIDVRVAGIDRRDRSLDDRARNLDNQVDQLKAAKQDHLRELERIAGLSAGQARQLLMREL